MWLKIIKSVSEQLCHPLAIKDYDVAYMVAEKYVKMRVEDSIEKERAFYITNMQEFCIAKERLCARNGGEAARWVTWRHSILWNLDLVLFREKYPTPIVQARRQGIKSRIPLKEIKLEVARTKEKRMNRMIYKITKRMETEYLIIDD